MIEVEVRRYAPSEADTVKRREEEEARQREQAADEIGGKMRLAAR